MSYQPDNERDPRLPKEPLRTVSGTFKDIRLDFTTQPPEPKERRSTIVLAHQNELARLHILLDGIDALAFVPSAYLYLMLSVLVDGISKILAGGVVISDWVSDPWQIEVKGDPKHNHAFITVHSPRNNWVAMRNVCVPLDQFAQELINLERRWLKYLDKVYPEETRDPVRGEYFRNMLGILADQEKAFRKYQVG